ncbi:MAG: serine--tRNA ligase, partial [Planctomycetota bacterium]|nr:serine--tRNA ligase [Planctomycetota bacterium]
MLDRKFIVENIELVEENCRNRGVDIDVHRMAELDQVRREKQTDVEQLNRRANEVSKSIGQAKDEEEREARKEEGRQLREQKDAALAEVDALQTQIDAIHRCIPNMSHADAPIGVDDKANLELRRGNTAPAEFDFAPKDHVELGEALDLFDFEAGGRVAGHGFYYLKNEAV